MSTPAAISFHFTRGQRAAKAPNSGAVSMYDTRNAEASDPDWALAAGPSGILREKRLANLRFHRRQHLAVDVVEEIHRQQQPQRHVGPGNRPRRPA